MTKFYSPSTKGFYAPDIHGSTPGSDRLPADAVTITDDQWQALLTAQGNGQSIVTGTDGQPTAVDAVPTVSEQSVRMMRNNLISSTDWLVTRHRDQVDGGAGSGTTLTSAQYVQLLTYRQALRDISKQSGFPTVTFPTAPSFV